jgi:MFS transporter, DHA1 family, tetracycline resistance protein
MSTNLKVAPPGMKGRRAAAAFILFTVVLDMLALGMIIPVLPRLIGDFTHGDAVKTSQILGLFGTIFATMQFVSAPVLGALSDRFGRRPVVLLSNLGLGLDYLLVAWAPALSWLFLARFISGVTASSVPTAIAYMTDITPPEKRAATFGMVNAAFGIGFVLGPAVGGILGNSNPRLPFLAAAALSILNAVYGFFILPESLALEHRCPFSWKRANPVGSLALLGRYRSIAVPVVMIGLASLTQQALTIYVIYVEYRYHWMDRTIGLSLAAVGVFAAAYGVLLVPRVVVRFGERRTVQIGLAAGTIGFLMVGMARTSLLFCLAIPVFNLLALFWPSVQSMVAHGVGPAEQGQLQGMISSLRGVAGLIGPGLFGYLFSTSIGPHAIVDLPGMPYLVAAGLLLLSLLISQLMPKAPASTSPRTEG